MSKPEHADAVTNFMRNAWEPIAVPRWAITLKYVLFSAVGLAAFFAGVQTLDLSTPAGYVPVWAAFMSLGAILGTVGSFRPKWGWVEAIGASILFAFLIVLTVLVFDRGALTVGLLLVIVNVLPGVRAFFLVTRIVLALSRREEWKL